MESNNGDNKFTMLIGGDICPTESNEDALINCDIDEIFTDVKTLFDKADFRFANIECALTERGTAIDKCGPNLRAKPDTIKSLKAIGLDLCGGANNHSLDWGRQGLADTIEIMKQYGIPYTGAGMNIDEARAPYRISKNGVNVTILTVAEHEFTIADKKRAGANPFDPYDTVEDIEAAKHNGDIVVVIYHGGKEQYAMTSPNTRRRCRKMAEHGADFIFCQHTHCICCCEDYKGCHICYGQGNTLFDHSSHVMWKTELIPIITVGCEKSVEYIPVTQENGRMKIAIGADADNIMKPFYERSSKLDDDDYIEACWREFYMNAGKALLKYAKVLNADGEPDNYRDLTVLSNYYRCEIHHETIYDYIEEARRLHYGDLQVKGYED